MTQTRVTGATGAALLATGLVILLNAADSGGAPGQAPAVPLGRSRDLDTSVWRLNAETSLSFAESESESSLGTIKLLRSGEVVASWETDSFARWFGTPAAIGSYPAQCVLVPYFHGGGTGVAQYHWCIVVFEKGRNAFYDMGLWAYWSYFRDEIVWDFRLSPDLLSPRDHLVLNFSHMVREDRETKVISGQVALTMPDRKTEQAELVPVILNDAMACMELLESPCEGARQWGAQVLQSVVPAELVPELMENNGQLRQNTKERMRVILTDHYGQLDR